MKLTKKQLNKVLDLHEKWVNDEDDGEMAVLREAYLVGYDLSKVDLGGADLRGAYLRGAYLSGANLTGANLTGANLSGANLSKTYLSGAYLCGADLTEANLGGADLTEANLGGADLRGANLGGADLSWAYLVGTNLTNAKLPDFQIPQDEDLIVWKKIVKNTLVKLRIPKEAKRTGCLINNKCRAEYAEVLEIIGEGRCSMHAPSFIYEVGKIVKPDSYNDDIREDCRPGIHFFMTKTEVKKY